MGLDNYPREYPCLKNGTAVLDDMSHIDCHSTQVIGGCPWKDDLETSFKPSSGTLNEAIVYGMFGTDCWYRGKHGNWLSDELGVKDFNHGSFYGDNEHGTEKSPESCLNLASLLEEKASDKPDDFWDDSKDLQKSQVEYAVWYLRWAAEKTDGLMAWY